MSEGLVVLGFISLESASGKRKGEEEIRWKIMRCFCRKFCFSVIRNMFNQIKVSPETIWHVISTFRSFSPSLSLLYANSSVDLDCTSERSDEYIILRAFQWYLHYKVTVKLLLPLWCRINQNHSITALSSYHRYLRSISYEYFIFFNTWTCPYVVHRGCCDRPMEQSTQCKLQLSATRRHFLSWVLSPSPQSCH